MEKRENSWLKGFQENSWEAEILISGGAIFSLFQLTDGILWLYNYLKGAWVFPGLDLSFLLTLIATKGLTIGFIIHLILRSYWIALSCIHFAFNESKDDRIASLQNRLISLDKTSGLFFATSILFVIFIVGLYPIFILLGIASVYSTALQYLILILYLLFLIDNLLNEKISQARGLKYILKYVFAFFNYVSLSFLFSKPLLATFKNFGWAKSAVIASVFLISTVLFSFNDAHRVLGLPTPFDQRGFTQALSANGNYSPYHYISESNGLQLRPQIQSPIVTDNFLRIQIGYSQWNDQAIIEKGVNTYAELIQVQLNDSILNQVKWKGLQPKIDDHNYGLVSFIDIRHLPAGEHTVKISRFQHSTMEVIATIPFWKNN